MTELPKKKLTIFLVGSILMISFVFYGYQIVFTPNILTEQEQQKLFVIRKGTSYRQILENLNKARIVNDMVSFSLLARLSGYDKEIIPGRYIFRSGMTNLQAIKMLKSGKQELVNITFTYARLRTELEERITKNIGMSPEEFHDALEAFVRNNKEGFTTENIRCMFIPNTYQVYFNIQPEELVERMHTEYQRFWNSDRLVKATKAGLTPLEVSILASIVQAETIKNDEAPVIAGLYINRMKKDIALQADPTLVYAAGDFTIKRVLNEHKEINSPYNTYKYPGLPPGPINVPQISNIDAVLDYDHNNYFYMCAREDFSGYHRFANNLADHNVNARKYQKALAIELKKAEEKNK